MLSDISVICLVLTFIMVGHALGGEYEGTLESEPTTIDQLITPQLKMICVLNRQDRASIDTTQFKDINSIVITKSPGDVEVAKVSKDQPAKALSFFKGASLRENVFDSQEPGDQVYLEVIVKHPQGPLKGDYRCTVKGLDDRNQDTTMTKDCKVEYTAATSLEEVAKYIHNLELQQEKKDASQDENVASQISNIKTKNGDQDTEITNIKTKNGDQDTEINNIKTKNRNQDTEINKRVSKSDIQQGDAYCYPRTGKDIRPVSFSHRYSKAPRVFLSVRDIDGNAASNPDGSYTDDDTGSEYWIEAYPVTQTGFRLRCDVYRYSYIKEMSVQWIAFPRP